MMGVPARGRIVDKHHEESTSQKSEREAARGPDWWSGNQGREGKAEVNEAGMSLKKNDMRKCHPH